MIRLAIAQLASSPDKAANLADITRLTEQAAAEGADLVVFPEYAMHYIRSMGPEFVAEGEALDGPFVQQLTALAQRFDVAIVAGMSEAISGVDRVYNSLAYVTADGLQEVYHKAHLYDAFGFKESDFMRPGELDGPVTFEVGGVKVGMLTCYDLRFPEAARQHADAGVEVLLYPAAWVPGDRKVEHWVTLARARAIENTFFVVGVDQAPGAGVGNSVAVDPAGDVLAQLGEEVGLGIVDIDPARVAEVRGTNPSLVNRRFTVSGKE